MFREYVKITKQHRAVLKPKHMLSSKRVQQKQYGFPLSKCIKDKEEKKILITYGHSSFKKNSNLKKSSILEMEEHEPQPYI